MQCNTCLELQHLLERQSLVIAKLEKQRDLLLHALEQNDAHSRFDALQQIESEETK
jgi:hypothetical protein